MIDENEFFRNITLKICGNLKSKEALRACSRYPAHATPADVHILNGMHMTPAGCGRMQEPVRIGARNWIRRSRFKNRQMRVFGAEEIRLTD